jgi:hypothetical protein
MSDEPLVSYPISQVLKDISDKIDKMMDLLSGKADKEDLNRLASRVDGHDEHLRVLLDDRERHRQAKKEHREWVYWLWPTLAAAISAAAMLMTVLH